MSAGTNQLIKNGANLLTEAQDVLDFLGIEKSEGQLTIINDDNQDDVILRLIGQGVKDTDELQLKSGLNTKDFQVAITELEISGIIQENSKSEWNLS